MHRRILTVAVFGALSLVSVAQATITWDFSSIVLNAGNLSGTVNSTGPGGNPKIIAYGVNGSTGAAEALAVKTGGGSGITAENGLGNNLGTNNEIDTTHIVELDISSLAPSTSISILMTSLQAGEGFKYAAKDSAGIAAYSAFTVSPGFGFANLLGVPTNDPFTFTRDSAATEFIAIEATNNDVLLATATGPSGVSPTPEPRFYGFLLVSLLGIAAVGRRFVPQQ